MSIFIKGMEMPKCCGICLYNKSSCYCGITKSEVDRDYEYAERLADCPLVSVPPHGDLIDKDILVKKKWDADTRCGYVQVVDVGDIINAPVIIEAEDK